MACKACAAAHVQPVTSRVHTAFAQQACQKLEMYRFGSLCAGCGALWLESWSTTAVQPVVQLAAGHLQSSSSVTLLALLPVLIHEALCGLRSTLHTCLHDTCNTLPVRLQYTAPVKGVSTPLATCHTLRGRHEAGCSQENPLNICCVLLELSHYTCQLQAIGPFLETCLSWSL
jgi:hypothetical protein